MKFIDTNVLVYIADKHDVDKREIAKKVVSDAMRSPEEYLLSAQALAEFSNVSASSTWTRRPFGITLDFCVSSRWCRTQPRMSSGPWR